MTQQQQQTIPTKGGVAFPQGLKPLDQLINESLMTPFRSVYGNYHAEWQAHRFTLRILVALKSGQLSLDDLVATDEGWQIVPKRGAGTPEPEEDVPMPTSNGAAAGADIPSMAELVKDCANDPCEIANTYPINHVLDVREVN